MKLVFSKKKMIDRITKEGRADMIDAEVIRIMNNLDGLECIANCWRRQIYDEPVYAVTGLDGIVQYVNENDTEWVV